jgi:hypothetical protein
VKNGTVKTIKYREYLFKVKFKVEWVRIALKNSDVYWAPALDSSEAKGKPFSRNI